MEIKDLEAKQGKVEIVIEITEKGDIREFNKFGSAGKVCNAKAKDASGEIKLTLWNEQIDQVKVGDKIKVSNGYVNEYQGEKQLTTGKFGTLEVVSGDATETPSEAPAEETKEATADISSDAVEEEFIQ